MQWPVLPDYGCIIRWPQDGQSFIHPEDIAIATRCFPSERVFRRDSFDGTYYHFRYGETRFRLRPCMWLAVNAEGIDIGDTVETVGQGLQRELFVASVWGMHFIQRKGRIVYRLRRGEKIMPHLYPREHLKLITSKGSVREGYVEYPEPQWKGKRDTLDDVTLD